MPKTSQETLDKEATDAAERLSKGSGSTPLPENEPIPLSDMLAEGMPVTIADTVYRIAPFQYKNLGKASRLLALIPRPFITHALAAAQNGGQFDLSKTVKLTDDLNSSEMTMKLSGTAVVRKIIDGVNTIRRTADPPLDQIEYPDGINIDVSDIVPKMSVGALEYAMTTAIEQTDEQAEAGVELVHLAISRKQPEVTIDEIGDSLEQSSFLPCLCAIFMMNNDIRKSF